MMPAATLGCRWCGAPLDACGAEAFCGEDCKRKWALRDKEKRRMDESEAKGCENCACGDPSACKRQKEAAALRDIRLHVAPPPPRRGDWIQVYSGIQFWPLDPREDEILVTDVAHALAQQCRFTGHTREFYSIAEHSVRVSDLVARWLGPDALCDLCLGLSLDMYVEDYVVSRPGVGMLLCGPCAERRLYPVQIDITEARWKLPLMGLGHDGSEAYLCDIARPVKHLPEMEPYRDAEHGLQSAVYGTLGVGMSEARIVKRADDVLLATEARDLMSPLHPKWTVKPPVYPVLPETIEPWGPKRAEREWLHRYRRLIELRKGKPIGAAEPALPTPARGELRVAWSAGDTEEDVLRIARDLYRAAQVPR